MASKKSGKAAGLAALAGLAYMASQKGGKTAPDRDDADTYTGSRASKSEDATESGDFLSRRLKTNPESGAAYSMDNLSPMSSGKSASTVRAAPAKASSSSESSRFAPSGSPVAKGAAGIGNAKPVVAQGGNRSVRSEAQNVGGTGSGGGRGPAIGEEQRARIDRAFEAPSEENIQKGLEVGVGGPSLRALSSAAKGLANRGVGSKFPQLDRPGTVSGEKFVMRDYKDPNVAASVPQKALPAPRKGDVTDVTPKNTNPRSLMGEAREDAKADRFRRGLEDLADNSMKRGGKVKKMASGGMTSSASSASRRGDGIASKGKTRCKMY